MKYTTEEALAEIMYRSDCIIHRKGRRLNQALSVAVIVLFTALVSAITLLKGSSAESSDVSVYGSVILGKEAGGYVLVALLAFILGIAVTFFCQNYKKRKGDMEEKDKN